MSHPSFVCSYFPESNCKLSKVRQAISDAAECTACIPCSAVMSSIHKVWKLVIQGQQNKAANRESKYITAHFSPPELNWQCWISKFGPGPNGNNSTHSSLEWRERRTAASWEPGRHLADLCCMTRVGTEWELVHCPLAGCVCVFAIMTEFFWARHSRKKHL